MLKKLAIAAALTTSFTAAHAYQAELGASINVYDVDHAGTETGFAIDGTYYFNPVEVKTYPLNEAAFLNRVIFCGVIPGVFLWSVKSIRPPRPLLTVCVYSLWGGLWGVACDGFYTFQDAVFGSGTDVATLVRKTLVDQLVWNVFICTPVNAIFFPWVAGNFKRGPGRSCRDFAQDCLVLLVANWIVWIPVTVAVYAFPLPLQIQLVGLACSFWMLVALRAAARNGEE